MARPRSSEAHEKVLHAALDLFGERGIEAASMDAIARASGVSKATIYNHWTDKEALLLEVMDRVHGLDSERQEPDTGDTLEDLVWALTRQPPTEYEEARTRLTPSLIAYSATHRDFGQAWRRRVMQPGRESIRRILESGIRRGLLRPVDIRVAIALLMGPMLYNHIFSGESRLAHGEMGRQVAEAFWSAFAIHQPSGEKHSPRRSRP